MVTDSGGLQEETTALGIPCLTVRENTERPITIVEGTNRLVPDPGALADAMRAARRPAEPPRPEGWDGRAGERIVRALAPDVRIAFASAREAAVRRAVRCTQRILMKQVLRKGLSAIVVEDVPDPLAIPHHVVVRPSYSLISSGTETASIHKEGVLKEVADNPSHLRKVWNVAMATGPLATVSRGARQVQ